MSQGIAGRGAFVRPSTYDYFESLPVRSARPASRPAHSRILAEMLGVDLATISSADTETLKNWQKKFGPHFLVELDSLRREPDRDLFYHGLLNFGARLEEQDLWEGAASVYSGLAEKLSGLLAAPETHPHLRKTLDTAARRLDAILGRGALGPRVAFSMLRFSTELSDPSPIAAMGVAGMAFKLGKFAALSRLIAAPAESLLTRGFGAKAISSLAGFSLEIPVWTFSLKGAGLLLGRPATLTDLPNDLASSALFLGPLKFMAWGGAALFATTHRAEIARGSLNAFSRVSQKIMAQGGAFAGVLTGQSFERSFHGAKPPDFLAGLGEGLATLLHLNVSGSLARRAWGERFHAFERDLESRTQALSGPTAFWTRMQERAEQMLQVFEPAKAVAGGPAVELPLPRELPRIDRYANSSLKEFGSGKDDPPFPTPNQAEKLEEQFYPILYPSSAEQSYPRTIIRTVNEIPGPFSGFHLRLLEALATLPNHGSLSQLQSVMALRATFKLDALHSSAGNWEAALLQYLTGKILADESPLGLARTQELLHAMEAGLNRTQLEEMIARFDLGEALRYSWDYGRKPEYRQYLDRAEQEKKYPAELLEEAIDFAREHPYGGLAFQRLIHILAAQDHPAKIKELQPLRGNPDTLLAVLSLAQDKQKPEAIASALNGTWHTAFVDDIRVARKWVSVYSDIHPYLLDPSKRERAYELVKKEFFRLPGPPREIDQRELLHLLSVNPNEEVNSLIKAVKRGRLELKFVEDAQMKENVESWKNAPHNFTYSMFLNAYGQPTVLFRRQVPENIHGAEAKMNYFNQVFPLFRATLHEFEHYRHLEGHFEGMEKASRTLDVDRGGRHERVVSEMLSGAEEERLALRFLEKDYWEISRRMGGNLSFYYRDRAIDGYFGKLDRAKSKPIKILENEE